MHFQQVQQHLKTEEGWRTLENAVTTTRSSEHPKPRWLPDGSPNMIILVAQWAVQALFTHFSLPTRTRTMSACGTGLGRRSAGKQQGAENKRSSRRKHTGSYCCLADGDTHLPASVANGGIRAGLILAGCGLRQTHNKSHLCSYQYTSCFSDTPLRQPSLVISPLRLSFLPPQKRPGHTAKPSPCTQLTSCLCERGGFLSFF